MFTLEKEKEKSALEGPIIVASNKRDVLFNSAKEKIMLDLRQKVTQFTEQLLKGSFLVFYNKYDVFYNKNDVFYCNKYDVFYYIY